MSGIIPKTKKGMFGFVAVIIFIIVMNWPVMKWAYSLQKPPDIVYVFGLPFAIFWAFFACIVMLVIWIYTMATVGRDVCKKVEENQTFKELLQEQAKREEEIK